MLREPGLEEPADGEKLLVDAGTEVLGAHDHLGILVFPLLGYGFSTTFSSSTTRSSTRSSTGGGSDGRRPGLNSSFRERLLTHSRSRYSRNPSSP